MTFPTIPRDQKPIHRIRRLRGTTPPKMSQKEGEGSALKFFCLGKNFVPLGRERFSIYSQ